MFLPEEVPVMTLPNAILFPQVMLPLYIFEPRYRKMLADSLDSHRIFAIAMQKRGSGKGTPSNIAGLGLIRAAVTHPDGTSHLVLQGLGRIELGDTVKQRPYRRQRFRFLETKQHDGVRLDALTEKVLDLVAERFKQGFPFPILNTVLKLTVKDETPPDKATIDNIIDYLSKLENPDQLADLVSCTLLAAPAQRQTILETVDVEDRLKHLIHFLIADIQSKGEK